jgi:hypothetical protein
MMRSVQAVTDVCEPLSDPREEKRRIEHKQRWIQLKGGEGRDVLIDFWHLSTSKLPLHPPTTKRNDFHALAR